MPRTMAGMRRQTRRAFGTVAVMAGVALILFDGRRALAGDGEAIFWVIVAALLVAFGVAEAVAKPEG